MQEAVHGWHDKGGRALKGVAPVVTAAENRNGDAAETAAEVHTATAARAAPGPGGNRVATADPASPARRRPAVSTPRRTETAARSTLRPVAASLRGGGPRTARERVARVAVGPNHHQRVPLRGGGPRAGCERVAQVSGGPSGPPTGAAGGLCAHQPDSVDLVA